LAGEPTAGAKVGALLLAQGEATKGVADAVTWIHKAAQGGDKAAVAWLERATAEGSVAAEGRLADLYASGKGVTADVAKAIRLYQHAADNGDSFAQVQLGLRYAKGEGVEQSYVQAHKWVNLAAVDGNVEAAKSREVFSKLMTPEQLAEAHRLTREWAEKRRAAGK
jgi:TPR repeat protein